MQRACAGLSWERYAPARALQGCPGMCRDHVGAQCQVHVCGVSQIPPPQWGIQSMSLKRAVVPLKMIKYFWMWTLRSHQPWLPHAIFLLLWFPARLMVCLSWQVFNTTGQLNVQEIEIFVLLQGYET